MAAHLSRGIPLKKLGKSLKYFVRLKTATPIYDGDRIRGEIIYVDRFGNAITNIEQAQLRKFSSKKIHVIIKKIRLCRVMSYYEAVTKGEPVAVPGSTGFLEIAVNGGSAANQFGLKTGDPVLLRVEDS
jgi:S-adenosylmethionine hydrolase